VKKHPESHMDHGFTAEQWVFLFKQFADRRAFFLETVELPEGLGTVDSELYGPSAGHMPVIESEVFYARRGQRTWLSRMVRRPKQPTRFVRVIAGPHDEPCTGLRDDSGLTVACVDGRIDSEFVKMTCPVCSGSGRVRHACILYTAYGVAHLDMHPAPKELGDLEAQLAAFDIKPTQESLQQLASLKAKLSEAKIFWSTHALAAPIP
jgi:hypothetical protein